MKQTRIDKLAFGAAACMWAVLASCHGTEARRTDAPANQREELGVSDEASLNLAEAEPPEVEQQAETYYDKLFDSEGRASWAMDMERIVDSGMTNGGGAAIERIVCRTTVCKGVYRFDSREARMDAWEATARQVEQSVVKSGFGGRMFYVNAGGIPPQVQDRYYVIKIPNPATPGARVGQ